MTRRRLLLAALASAVLSVALGTGTASAQTLTYRYGPIDIAPGDNTINFRPDRLRPSVPGYITAFRPNLTYVDGKVPRVDVVHLHHGVWLVNLYPTFAAGEEKTNVELPAGYGYRYEPSDTWTINYMIHNLTPTRTKVYLTYQLDFIPAGAPEAQGLKTVRTQWMDVQSGRVYPVFDALRRPGRGSVFRFPADAAPDPYAGRPAANQWTADQDGTLVYTAGHVHPGGLYTDLTLTRGGRTVRVFRSRAKYFEPAGPVSWDLAMQNTPPDWRVQVRKGDVLRVSGAYDVRRASWYESMAIMPVAFSPGDTTGVDPFSGRLDTRGVLNHGPLAENRNHGGQPAGLPDPRRLRSGAPMDGRTVTIKGFLYQRGDLSLTGRRGRPPTVRQGDSITFRNLDDATGVWHTITACRAPCNRSTGIAYPLADARAQFDSGELGTGPAGRTAAANRTTWATPRNLRPGTYTYFCRIHPFMRGSFRVVAR